MSAPVELSLNKITVGARGRKELGDLDELSQSIERVGLLHPLVLNSRHELIAGLRRLTVVKRLGWKTVPVRVVKTLDDACLALRAELEENAHREPMKPSEIVELGRRIEAAEKPAAKQRQGTRTDLPQHSGTSSGMLPGDTRDKVGETFGISGKHYEQMKKVVDEGTPGLVEAMDSGDIPVTVAAKIAELPEEVQEEIVEAEEPRSAAREYLSAPPGPNPDPPEHFADLIAACTRLSTQLTKACKQNTEEGRRLHTYLGWCGLLEHDAGVIGAAGASFLPLKGVPAILRLAGESGKIKRQDRVESAYAKACGIAAYVPAKTQKRRNLKSELKGQK